MAEYTHVFQISGIKNPDKKRVLIQGILKLGGRYIGGSVSRPTTELGKCCSIVFIFIQLIHPFSTA